MTSNLAAVLHGVDDLRIEDIAMPEPGPHEVLVEVQSVGVCGSDTHYLTHGRIGRFVVEAPLVLGHEAAGVVTEVGSAVDDITPGTRVAIEPGVPCGSCARCRGGRYNLCPRMRFMATPPVDGALARYVVLPAANVFAVPDSMSYDVAALAEPLSVGIWSTRCARLEAGETVLVTGAGPVGLLAAAAARALGARQVVVTDVSDVRLALAAQHGHEIRNVASTPLPDLSEDFDVALECSGAPGALAGALRQLAPGGRATMVGVPHDPDVALPLPLLHDREISVTTNFRYANTWPLAISLLDSGRVDSTGIVTDHFPLADSESALRAGSRSPHTVKAVVHPQE